MPSKEVDLLKRALGRERQARKQAENILEKKASELYDLSLELKNANNTLETLLQEKNSELRGVFENIVDAYVVMDLTGYVIKMNQAAVDMLRFENQQDPTNLMSLVIPEERPRIMASFSKLLEDGALTNFEVRIRTKSNEQKLVHINASVVYNSEGLPIAGQGIVRDITNIRSLEKQKEDLLKRLERSNDELTEYAHIVSHDLKTPLRHIDALVKWIKEDCHGKLDETAMLNFDLVESTLEKMEGLISAVLKYSSAKFDIEQKKIEALSEIVTDALDLLVIPEHIHIAIAKDLPQLLCHRAKMIQVFHNLIGNAIKYMDKDRGEIVISYESRPSLHVIAITDNGMGIPARYHQAIFKVFQSVEKKDNSHGIGLSIVKKVVEHHNGSVWVESTEGKGTTFYLGFPEQPGLV